MTWKQKTDSGKKNGRTKLDGMDFSFSFWLTSDQVSESGPSTQNVKKKMFGGVGGYWLYTIEMLISPCVAQSAAKSTALYAQWPNATLKKNNMRMRFSFQNRIKTWETGGKSTKTFHRSFFFSSFLFFSIKDLQYRKNPIECASQLIEAYFKSEWHLLAIRIKCSYCLLLRLGNFLSKNL